ncbi:uncharacterized protein LOC118751046, partial [Rhagoletis pomonella]|uniref:uncharacterized protein LOC118751046 n=1 Tax=Rhagoletis pomonella TaxID=28610 RepID=UPI001780C1ED
KVNGHETKAIIDSGSVCLLIRRSVGREKIGKTVNCTRVLQGFAGGTYERTAKILVSLEIDNDRHQAKLLVVDNDHIDEDVLLGRDVFCQNGKRLVIENDKCTVEKLKTISNISLDERFKLKSIIQANRDVFAETVSELGKCAVSKMNIKLTDDKPICMKPYRVPFAKRKIVCRYRV